VGKCIVQPSMAMDVVTSLGVGLTQVYLFIFIILTSNCIFIKVYLQYKIYILKLNYGACVIGQSRGECG